MEAGLCGSRRGYCVRWQEEMVPRIRCLFFPLFCLFLWEPGG